MLYMIRVLEAADRCPIIRFVIKYNSFFAKRKGCVLDKCGDLRVLIGSLGVRGIPVAQASTIRKILLGVYSFIKHNICKKKVCLK
jgi:hypothetical protein